MRTAQTMCCRLIKGTDLSTKANVGATPERTTSPRQADVYEQAGCDHMPQIMQVGGRQQTLRLLCGHRPVVYPDQVSDQR